MAEFNISFLSVLKIFLVFLWKSIIINNAIDALKENPFYGRNIKRLRGQLEGKYRLGVGDYRIIYRIEGEEKVVIE